MERRLRNILVEKENDHKNVNKKEKEPDFEKMERLLKIKKINSLDQNRQIRGLKNSKEVRAPSKSFADKGLRHQLKPLTDTLTNTQQYCQLYASEIIEQSHIGHQPLGSFLISHDIDKGLRARMLDWMIEVTSSYKFTNKTYFTGVHLMDRYFKAEDSRLPITKLHIIGVISMLIATKMDEVYPLKIKTVYDKIVHKKIDKRELIDMEARITGKLDFVLNVWSFYDLALLKLHENWQVKNDQLMKDIEDLCGVIGKYIVFNYELYGHYPINILAEALLRAAFRVYGSERAKMAVGDREGFDTSRDQHACLQLIMDTMRGFKSNHKNLTNIFKFSNEAAMLRVQDYIKYC